MVFTVNKESGLLTLISYHNFEYILEAFSLLNKNGDYTSLSMMSFRCDLSQLDQLVDWLAKDAHIKTLRVDNNTSVMVSGDSLSLPCISDRMSHFFGELSKQLVPIDTLMAKGVFFPLSHPLVIRCININIWHLTVEMCIILDDDVQRLVDSCKSLSTFSFIDNYSTSYRDKKIDMTFFLSRNRDTLEVFEVGARNKTSFSFVWDFRHFRMCTRLQKLSILKNTKHIHDLNTPEGQLFTHGFGDNLTCLTLDLGSMHITTATTNLSVIIARTPKLQQVYVYHYSEVQITHDLSLVLPAVSAHPTLSSFIIVGLWAMISSMDRVCALIEENKVLTHLQLGSTSTNVHHELHRLLKALSVNDTLTWFDWEAHFDVNVKDEDVMVFSQNTTLKHIKVHHNVGDPRLGYITDRNTKLSSSLFEDVLNLSLMESYLEFNDDEDKDEQRNAKRQRLSTW